MKIIFIEPRAKEANVYSKLSIPLLGPVYLGTILKKRGHEVEIYNEDISTPDYPRLEADLFGISILTSTANRGYEIAGKFPKEKVLIGGVHASLLPEEAIEYARQVVVGEAEEVIADIVEGRLRDPIVYGARVKDLDLLPEPDFSLIKGYSPFPFIMPISTSRGCPFDCSFCSVTKMFGREYRFRSSENVVKELRSRSARSFFICDDNFTANPSRARHLLNLMLENRVRPWTAQVRCDVARDEQVLDLMARAGCKTVCIGFESVNPVTLREYKKNQTVEEIVQAIRSIHKRKISIHGMFVLGGESDSKNTVWETLRFAVRQKIDTIQMMVLTPFPGTKVHEDLSGQRRIFNRDWRFYDGQHVVFRPRLLSAKQLQLNVLSAYTKFYSLSRFFALLFKLKFRNALFRFMGYRIVREWKNLNSNMCWLSGN